MITLNLHTRTVKAVEHRNVRDTHWLHIEDALTSMVSIHGDKQFVDELEASFRSYFKRTGRELPPREDAMELALVTEVL